MGYDTIKLFDEEGNIEMVPLAKENVKLLWPDVDAKGKPGAATVAGLKKGEKSFNAVSIAYNIDKKLNSMQLNGDPKLVVQYGVREFRTSNYSESSLRNFMRLALGEDGIKVRVENGTGLQDVSFDGKSNVLTLRNINGKNFNDPIEAVRFLTGQLSLLKNAGVIPDKAGRQVGLIQLLQNVAKKRVTETDIITKVLDRNTGRKTSLFDEGTMRTMLASEFNGRLERINDTQFRAVVGNSEFNGTLSEIYKQMKPLLVPISRIRKEAALAGLKIIAKKDGTFQVGEGKKAMSFNSITELVTKTGLDITALPSKYRPNFVEVSADGSINILAEGNTLSLGKRDAIKLLNSFDDGTFPDRLRLLKGERGGFFGIAESFDSISFIDHTTKTKMAFPTVKAAEDFMKNEYGTFFGLERVAKAKGHALTFEGGKYTLRAGDKNTLVFNNRAEAEAYLSTVDSRFLDATESIPGFADIAKDIPSDILRQWTGFTSGLERQALPDFDDIANFNPALERSIIQAYTNNFSTFKAAFGRMVRKGMIPPATERYVNQLIKASENMNAEVYSFRKVVASAFNGKLVGNRWVQGESGKLLPVNRRRVIFKHIDAASKGADELNAVRKEFPLKPGEETVIRTIRDIFGQRTETGVTGLAAKFRIPLDQYLGGYISHMKKEYLSDDAVKKILRGAATPEEAFMKLSQIPKYKDLSVKLKEMKLSFEYNRTADFIESIHDDDAMSVLLRYGESGLRKFWMDIPGQHFNQVLQSLNTPDGGPAKMLLTRFHEMILGKRNETVGLATVRHIGESMWGAFGRTMSRIVGHGGNMDRVAFGRTAAEWGSPEFAMRGNRLLSTVMNLSYSNLLGFRPMAAFRNSLQVFTMFGPTFGFDHLMNGLRTVQDMGEGQLKELAEKMIKLDVLTAVHQRLDIEYTQGLSGKLSDVSLRMFKNADDYTRTIAFMASTDRFASALRTFATGTLGDGEVGKLAFAKLAKLTPYIKNEPAFVNGVWDKLQAAFKDPQIREAMFRADGKKGGFDHPVLEELNNIIAQRNIQLTLFNYSPWNKPMLFNNGLFGKLFGQLGTFSAGYRNMLSQLMTNLPADEKVAFAFSFLASNLALFAAFSAANMKGNDFIPLLPGVVGTGPFYDISNDLIDIMNPTGWESGQAFKRLSENLLPFSIKKESMITEVGSVGSVNTLALQVPKMLPGGLLAHYLGKSSDLASKGDFLGAAMTLLGASVLPEELPDLATAELRDFPAALQGALRSQTGTPEAEGL